MVRIVRVLMLSVVFVSLGFVAPVSIRKAQQKVHERAHCAHCGAKLKVAGGRRAAVCQQCGREQPWAAALMGHGRG